MKTRYLEAQTRQTRFCLHMKSTNVSSIMLALNSQYRSRRADPELFYSATGADLDLPSQTSHSQSLSGREDCYGSDLWSSGVGLDVMKKREQEALSHQT